MGIDRLPHFLGLGVQKGGTTTLQRLLEQHPQIWLSPEKELHYFSLYFNRGRHWYSNCFADASPDQCCGDITPYYVFHPQAPERIANLLPDARLIVLLRDPVERCLSQYFHSRRLGLESLELEDALAAESARLAGAEQQLESSDGFHFGHQEHSYLARSRYEQQLNRYEERFSTDQILLLKSEDFFDRGAQIWDRVLSFLALDAIPFPQSFSPANVGQGEAAAVPEQVCSHLREQLQHTYYVMENRYQIRW